MEIDDIHRDILDRLNRVVEMGGGSVDHDIKINKYTLYDYISMGVANEVELWQIEDALVKHTEFNLDRVQRALGRYMADSYRVTDKPYVKPKSTGRKPKPVRYDGMVYPSSQVLADEMGVTLNRVRYWTQIGLVIFLP